MVDGGKIRCKVLAVLAILAAFSFPAQALQSIFMAWNPSQDSSVAGYMLFYGTNAANYDNQIDAGTNTFVEVTGLTEGQTNYFAVAAYDGQGMQGALSDEILYVVPGDSNAPQAGSLQVTLSVVEAEWAVDNGPFETNGATVAGLSVGAHTVTFSDVSGWTTPESETISIAANQTTSLSAGYVASPQTGSLQITLNVAGAQWALDNGELQTNGVTVSGLSIGAHTVTFSDVSGWTTPASQTISIAANQTTSVSAGYVAIPQTGSLQVTLNVAGAQWAVDNSELQTNGATVSGLSVGAHTVTFSAVSGWITPASQTISIAANQTNSITATYVVLPQTGSLEVTLNAAGAQWAVDNSELQTNGATVSGLSVGAHTVTFSAVSGWITPASQTISIPANQTTSVSAGYVAIPQTGSLQVTLNVAGAQWALDNSELQTNGATVSGLSVGAHTVTFSPVIGWTTPASQTISIPANQTNSITATYVVLPQTGSLEVTLNAASAQWAVDNSELQTNGATVSGLSVGAHTVTFSPVIGWTTPASQTISIPANQTNSITATYVVLPQTGSLEVTLNAAGAQWAVDNSELQTNGATVSGLSVGAHTVTFSPVIGWTTPASQTISIPANQTNSITATYVVLPQTGSLEVTLNAASAQWAVDNSELQTNGATVSGLSVGAHTVTFSPVIGWTTPDSQTISVAANQTTSNTATYVAIPPTGSLQVTLTPAAAQWSVDNGALQNSGVIASGLAVGSHIVNFSVVTGWTTSCNQTVAIAANQTNALTVTYIALPQATNQGTSPTTNATPNFTTAMKGTYNGLFYPADATTEATSGMLSDMTVKTNGKYSGKIRLDGGSLAFSGTFDSSGHASQVIARTPKLGGPLTLDMALTWNNALVQIAGTVSGTNGGAWAANLLADAAATSAKSYQYTLLIPPAATALETSPPGYGYATITNHAGTATVAGALADAAAFSQSVPVSADGSLPLYVAISAHELLLGWVTNLYSQTPGGEIVWIKEGYAKSVNYKGGFTNSVAILGSIWNTPAPKQAAIDLTNAALTFLDGDLAAPLNFLATVETNNTVVKSGDAPTNTMTGVINPRTGLIQLTFENGDGKAKETAHGAVLQNSQSAGGYFMSKTNGGAFELQTLLLGKNTD